MIPVPFGKFYLPFQLDGINFITSRRQSLLADEMGLGKTIQAIGAMNKLKPRRVLILCPASVKLNWQRELKTWLVLPKSIFIVSSRSTKIPEDAEIIICNYDLIIHSFIQLQLHDRQYSMLICDESHYLKNMKAKRTQAVLGRKGLVHKSIYKILMTGTPILNRPVELYPALKVLAADSIKPYDDYRSFVMRYCGGYEMGFQLIAKGASHSAELNQRLKKNFMLRRLESQVAKELPSKRYQLISLESNGVKNDIKVVDNMVQKQFKKQRLGMGGAELAKLRRELALDKLTIAIEHIKNMLLEVDKLVVFCFHREVIEKLFKTFEKENPRYVWGSQSIWSKQAALKEFQQNPKCRLFIGQIQAAGQGIDGLQKVCHHVCFLEWSWVPGEVSQAIKRVHRMGQKKPVLVQFLVWANSLEEHMMRTAIDKTKIIKETVNG